MKLGLYMEHGFGNGVGGAELLMAHLASVWSHDHDVELVHHRPQLTRERFALFTRDPLDRVNIRAVPRLSEPETSGDPITRFRAARDWQRSLSAPYDLFLNCTHWVPCFSQARAGALLVLFPFYVRPPDMQEARRLPAWKRLRMRAYYDLEWRQRLATYRYRWTISEYSRSWTARRWGINCPVIAPPVDIDLPVGPKDNLILTVGRFATVAHTKKQLEMLGAFERFAQTGPSDWTFACVGGLNTRPENQAYFDRVHERGEQVGALVEANVDRARVVELFGRARIYWHATGLGEDTDAKPELAEHFGMATVEAMAAGAVPVVVNKGGQPEIVQHGVNGFVWNTLPELISYTRLLADDRHLLARMSAAARARAQDFTRERFIERVSRLCRVPRGAHHPAPSPAYAT